MRIIGYIAIISFIAVAVFGFAGLMSGSAFMHCAKALSGVGGDCPTAFASGILHAKLYHGFSQALLASFLALLFMVLSFLVSVIAPLGSFRFQRETYSLFSPLSYRVRLYSWLSLHQTSDPLV
jgi:hypothetical protein